MPWQIGNDAIMMSLTLMMRMRHMWHVCGRTEPHNFQDNIECDISIDIEIQYRYDVPEARVLDVVLTEY